MITAGASFHAFRPTTQLHKPLIVWVLAAAILLNGFLLWHFHNLFWCPQDDGVFAYVASRLNEGVVLNKDIQESHPGLVHFLNAFALAIWGNDFSSLRYPLVGITLLESLMAFYLLLNNGLALAFAASFVPSALGLFHFLNPNPHWYSLFFTMAVAMVWSFVPKNNSLRLGAIGYLWGNIFLCRQLTALWVGMAILCLLFFEGDQPHQEKKGGLAKISSLAAFFILLIYLLQLREWVGFFLFGLWPLILLGWIYRRVQVPDTIVSVALVQMAVGGLLAFLPIVFYHLVHGSIAFWFQDVFVRSLVHLNQPFLNAIRFIDLLRGGAQNLLHTTSLSKFLNGLFWITMPLAAALNGAFLIVRLLRQEPGSLSVLTLPVIAAFYAVVSLHNQIPIYLFFTAGLSWLGFLKLSTLNSKINRQAMVAGITIFFCFIGIYYHAAQPVTRQWQGMIEGKRIPFVSASPSLPRTNLLIDENTRVLYYELVQTILNETKPEEQILTVPNDPELYFLTDRKNPLPFFSMDLGIRSPEELSQVYKTLTLYPPRLVIFLTVDKRNTIYSRRLMEFIHQRYELIKQFAFFEFYRLPRRDTSLRGLPQPILLRPAVGGASENRLTKP